MLWSVLPDEILLKIFTFLEDCDLVSASSTCKRWRRIYYDPVLWKSRAFELRGYCRSHKERLEVSSHMVSTPQPPVWRGELTDCEMLSKYVDSMGEYLHHIRIMCPSPNLLTAYNVARCVESLLTGLSSLKFGKETITSFQMSYLHFQETWSSFRSSKCLLVNSISHFLETQRNLVRFDMANSFMTPPFSFRVMKSVVRSRSRLRLQVLNIINYYGEETSMRIIGCQLRTVTAKCCNLKEIALNYSYLYAAKVVEICQILADSLETLTVYVTVYDFAGPTWEIISSDRWRMAQNACPRLGVKVEIEDWPRDPTAVLVPKLPLVELSIKGSQCPHSIHSFGGKTTKLLDHCAKHFALSVQVASFLVDGDFAMSSPSTNSLLNFIKKCKKLRSLVFSDTLVNCDYLAKVKAAVSDEGVTISIISV